MVDKRVTGKDVALRAGVTTATVSNVLNGKRNVGEATRKRVLAAVQELGYVPDGVAKSLRRRTSRTIGVVIEKNLSNPRYGRTVEGMLSEASARGWRVTLCRDQLRENGLADYLAAYYERQVDGIIFVSRDTVGPSAESLETIVRDRVPFVALDCVYADMPFTTIDFDYRGAARAVTERVLARHPRRVLYMRPERHNPQEDRREEGVRDACAASGLPEPLVLSVDVSGFMEEALSGNDIEETGVPSNGYLFTLSEVLRTAAAGTVRAHDAVISSWPGWSNTLSRAFPLPGMIYADLASDYLSVAGAEIFAEMPNYRAGALSVDAVIDLIEGGEPQAIVLDARCFDMGDLAR